MSITRLSDKADAKTNGELKQDTFKMRAGSFKFEPESKEWKKHGVYKVRQSQDAWEEWQDSVGYIKGSAFGGLCYTSVVALITRLC